MQSPSITAALRTKDKGSSTRLPWISQPQFGWDLACALTFLNRGAGYFRMGKAEKALDDLTEAIHLNPKCAAAFMDRGIVYATKGDYGRAIADMDESIRLIPNAVRPIEFEDVPEQRAATRHRQLATSQRRLGSIRPALPHFTAEGSPMQVQATTKWP